MLVPEPVVVTPSGDLASVHVPFLGKSLNTTLPVARAQPGCVMLFTFGALGGAGGAKSFDFRVRGKIKISKASNDLFIG
jgi:hypothetical protein